MLRALVTGWRRLEFSVQAPRVSAANIRIQKVTTAPVVRAEPRFELELQKLASMIGFTAPASITNWISLSATNIELLVGALNRFLHETLELTDLPSLNTGKNFSETISQISDQVERLEIGKGLSDTPFMLDQLIVRLTALRSFSDSLSFADNHFADMGLGKNETVNMGEAHSYFLAKTLEDSATMSESHSLSFSTPAQDTFSVATDAHTMVVGKGLTEAPALSEELVKAVGAEHSDQVGMGDADVLSVLLPKTDTTIVTESLSRVVSYARSFSDAFGIDDLISVAEVHVETKTNVFSFSDDQVLGVSKVLGDSASVNESLALHVFEGAKALGGSVLNAAPLN